MMKRSALRKASLIAALAVLFALAWTVLPSTPAARAGQSTLADELYPVNDYGWLTYYMHEVFERYNQAKKYFEKGDMDLANANLIVMELVNNVSKGHMPDTLADGKPFDKEGYKKSIDTLNSYSAQIRQNLEQKKWAQEDKDKRDPVMKTCVGCHAAYNIPTDFRIDNKYKVLTHIMHEVYELYRQGGILLKSEDWDQAKYCFIVVRPYIEDIPGNIPDKDMDGELMDKKLFSKAHKELKQFNDDMITRLETKNWMVGKPLPAPTVVVDTCYACHTKAAKIPPPW